MKFSPDTLLQIYLDGSFTEEAQAEFDSLMRKDPGFAEKVTQAVAERLGPVPDAQVDAIAGRLDAKAADLWAAHKPSPGMAHLKTGLKGLAALSLVAAGFWGFHHVVSLKPAPDATTVPVGQAAAVPADKVLPKAHKVASHPAAPAPDAEDDREATAGRNDQASVPDAVEKSVPAAPAVPKTAASSVKGDTLRVAIQSDKDALATVTIFDANGGLVRHLFRGAVQSGSRYVDWDGKNDLGIPVPPGSYNVVLDLNGKKRSGVLMLQSK